MATITDLQNKINALYGYVPSQSFLLQNPHLIDLALQAIRGNVATLSAIATAYNNLMGTSLSAGDIPANPDKAKIALLYLAAGSPSLSTIASTYNTLMGTSLTASSIKAFPELIQLALNVISADLGAGSGIPSYLAAQSIFTTIQDYNAPAFASSNITDGVPYELGLKFQATKDGYLYAIRYWAAASETGSHTGKVWSNAGTLLASKVFANEGATADYHQQALDTPVAITANTFYTVSVNINSHFGIESPFTGKTTGNLVALSSAGVLNASAGSFPTSSSGNQYFIDLVFA